MKQEKIQNQKFKIRHKDMQFNKNKWEIMKVQIILLAKCLGWKHILRY